MKKHLSIMALVLTLIVYPYGIASAKYTVYDYSWTDPEFFCDYTVTLPNNTNLTFKFNIIKDADVNTPGEVEFLFYDNDNNEDEYEILIPEKLQYNNFEYIVTRFGWGDKTKNLTIKLPNTVRCILKDSFNEIENLSINLPSSLEEIQDNTFVNCKIKSVSLDEGNYYFKVENNSIYSSDGKIAYHINVPNSGLVKVKEGIEHIRAGALHDNLKELILPKSLKIMDEYIYDIQYIEFKSKNPPALKSNLHPPYSDEYENYILVPKGSIKFYEKAKFIGAGRAFFPWRIKEENKLYNKTMKYLKKISTTKKLKSALVKPNGLTNQQWKQIVKKSDEITKGAKTDEEKAFKIYDWIINNFTYDYTAVDNSKGEAGTVRYAMVVRKNYDIKANYTYTAFKNKKGIDYAFVNVTTALMRAAGLPCHTILPEDTNQSWGTHFPLYVNIVFYNNSWHLVNTANGCINYVNDFGKYTRYNQNFNYFNYSWRAWALQEYNIPAIIDEIIPIKSTEEWLYSRK